MKILITNQFFKNYTGSEMSVLELSKQLVKQGHDVTVFTHLMGNPITALAKQAGVKVIDMPVDEKFDVIHVNHKLIGEIALEFYNDVPAIQHVRSEVIPIYEVPIVDQLFSKRIKYYVSIRPSITKYIKSYGIPNDKIVEINNGFDTSRFNINYNDCYEDIETILFVGTLDYLRYQVLMNLVTMCKNTKRKLWIIGADNGGYAKELTQYHNVTYFGVKPNVEDYIKRCDYTASIFNGRTAIESWLCGKPCWIYNVDKQGLIKSKKLVDVPNNINTYSIEYHTDKILELYNNI